MCNGISAAHIHVVTMNGVIDSYVYWSQQQSHSNPGFHLPSSPHTIMSGVHSSALTNPLCFHVASYLL